jgi:hypothetical protein
MARKITEKRGQPVSAWWNRRVANNGMIATAQTMTTTRDTKKWRRDLYLNSSYFSLEARPRKNTALAQLSADRAIAISIV